MSNLVTSRTLNSRQIKLILYIGRRMSIEKMGSCRSARKGHSDWLLDTLRLMFTANVKLLANFLFYNSIIMVFTKVLKYIRQLLNLWYLAII